MEAMDNCTRTEQMTGSPRVDNPLWNWGATVPLTLTFVLIFLWSWNSRRMRMSLLQRCGIPGPRPSLFTGNLLDCFSMPNVIFDSTLIKKYGSICGYYLGAKPIILISDPELLKVVLLEDAKNFRSRPRRVPGGISPDQNRAEMLGNLNPEKWTETRKVLSRAFTPSKLREMVPQIIGKIKIFLSKVVEGEQDLYPLFQALSLDIIGEAGFGVESRIQENVDDPLHHAVQAEFAKSPSSLLVKTYLCLPELSWLLQPFRIFLHHASSFLFPSKATCLWEMGFKVFWSRMSNPSKRRPDILQALLDSHLVEKPIRVVANSILFFEAAYETLSASMAFAVHLLVNHQEVQGKVREELRELLARRGRLGGLEYEDLKDLKYLECVLKEVLRMYPPQTTFIGRSGDRKVMHEKNGRIFTIPPNVHIQAGLYQLHHSEDLWEDPEAFIPERFQDTTTAATADKWQAFGRGPRVCIGQNFAWIVLKLVLGNLLLHFELLPSPKTEDVGEISLRFKVATMTPKSGSFAVIKKAVPEEE